MAIPGVSGAREELLEESAVPQTKRVTFSTKRALYVSHTLSTWQMRSFEFGAVLFLATIYPGTLLPVSVYALVRAASAIVFAPLVGSYVDNSSRLLVVRSSILGQRIPVLVSCIGFLYLLDQGDSTKFLNGLVFVILIVLACCEKLSAVANTIAIERDWVVVIAGNHSEDLQGLNSQMRQIDLCCKLLGPLGIALIDAFSSKIAVLVTLLSNTLSVAAEYFLIERVFKRTPALVRLPPTRQDNDRSKAQHNDYISRMEICGISITSILNPVSVYIRDRAFLPSLALAFLYLTVLSFSGQMTTFLLSTDNPRITSLWIGILRFASTILEISATFIAPRLISSIGAVRAGIWSLSWQLIWLTVGTLLFWVGSGISPALPVIGLIVGVILSRVGLWSFDLCAQLIIQESVEPERRGTFSSTEASLQNFFELCTFAMTIALPRPQQFRYPVLLSLAAVYVAAALYSKFVRDRRGHLLHLPRCLSIKARHRYRQLSTEMGYL